MKEIAISKLSGFQIGHASDHENGTGCTAILCPAGAGAGVDVRGGGPATRDTDLLDPRNTVDQVHGLLLSGGSAFGLEAATGVMQYLSEQGVGVEVCGVHVPIVVQADLFDLAVGKPVWPTAAMGYEAAKNSAENTPAMGNVGAGTGCTVGKMLGMENIMKSGLGYYALEHNGLQVAAIVAVNACGDVVDEQGNFMAGLYDFEANKPLSTADLMAYGSEYVTNSSANTTIAAILTNADLNKAQLNKLASMAHDAYAKRISPCHMALDGDTIFALSTQSVPADLNQVGVLAVRALSKAISLAIENARSAYGFPAWCDLQK
jgi:L-aminopeptidase/D-esterase-like protein